MPWPQRLHLYGVAARFVQNCTLSGPRQEHGGNTAQRAEVAGWHGGGPVVVASEGDVLPAERGDMGKQFIGYGDALGTQVPDGAVKIGGVPVHDGRCDQAEAGGAEVLVLERAVAELPLPVEKHSPAQRVAGLTLIEAHVTAPAQIGVG